MTRVVLTGSESTGKTTLAAELARHYGVEVVPEFVRTFAEQRGGVIEFSDHGAIARGQMALEDEFIDRARQIESALPAHPAYPAYPALVIKDTDLLSTVVYCKHYFGRCPDWIEDAARSRRPDLYLLCGTDVPWVPDGVRDRGHMRRDARTVRRGYCGITSCQCEHFGIPGRPVCSCDRYHRPVDEGEIAALIRHHGPSDFHNNLSNASKDRSSTSAISRAIGENVPGVALVATTAGLVRNNQTVDAATTVTSTPSVPNTVGPIDSTVTGWFLAAFMCAALRVLVS
jgi:nicotinamide riboside kinase